MSAGAAQARNFVLDPMLVGAVIGIAAIGTVMVGSASISLADRAHGEPFYFLVRHVAALAIGGVGFLAAASVPSDLWHRASWLLMALALLLLVLVLLPGLGREVNGSTRWLLLGPISVQASEPARLCLLLYLASYAVRRRAALATSLKAFVQPLAVVALASCLLLLEPDFGATAVLFATSLGILFVGGARIRDFLLAAAVGGAALGTLAFSSRERIERMTVFLDPFEYARDGGYQLTQSLMAIGRGEWFGVGLGESVQKLFYLPEAHTDFIFAVLAEELGFVGATLLLALFSLLVCRAFALGQQAIREGMPFQGLVAIGIGLMFGLEALINIGVNTGVLPTKGLALPLVSYGRSSTVVTLVAIGLLVRIHHELNGGQKRLVQRGQVR
jgi:cell division protein FtsW